jgi:hypothetical protein
MLDALGFWPQLGLGTVLAAGWLATAQPRPTTAATAPRIAFMLLRWGVLAVAVAFALLLSAAWTASALAGDAALSLQLRAAITDSALTLVVGAGLAGVGGLFWPRRA